MPRSPFAWFKATVYAALLAVTVVLFFTDATLSSFIDSIGWLMLLGVMEHESHRHRRPMVRRGERAAVVAASALAYAIILTAWWRYFGDGSWVRFVNATAWIGVVLVLSWQFYGPERAMHGVADRIKLGLYAVLVGCALLWTFGEFPVVEAVDAWLWLLCFSVIELNVFGFDVARPARIRPATASATDTKPTRMAGEAHPAP